MSNTADRILVVGPAWVGDVVMSQSLYMTLRWANPNVRIDVLAPPSIKIVTVISMKD